MRISGILPSLLTRLRGARGAERALERRGAQNSTPRDEVSLTADSEKVKASREWVPAPLRRYATACGLFGLLSLFLPPPFNAIMAGVAMTGALVDLYVLPRAGRFLSYRLREEGIRAFKDRKVLTITFKLLSFSLGMATSGAVMLNAVELARNLWLATTASSTAMLSSNAYNRLPEIREAISRRDLRALVEIYTTLQVGDPITHLRRGEDR